VADPQLRRSQIVTTFGPGAMIDLPDRAVMVSGLDFWRYDPDRVPVIEESRLVDKLRVFLDRDAVTLRAPPPAPEHRRDPPADIVAWEFPLWFIVQEQAMGLARRRRLVHATMLDKGKFRESAGSRALDVVPVRFVRACPRGHVSDIEWRLFTHTAQDGCMQRLWIEERGTSGDLDQVWITCDCGATRQLSDAARALTLGRCRGERPWLGMSAREDCDQPNRLLVRSASNAYFPQLLSVISIPDPAKPVDGVVAALWDDFLSDVEDAADLAKVRRKPTPAERLQPFSDEDVLAAVERRRSGTRDIRSVKEVEFEALATAADELGANVPDGDFYARRVPRATWDAPWMRLIKSVVLVHRLREVVALAGFTRCEPAGPDIQGELSVDAKRAALSTDQSWVPAIENRGEGVFLELDHEAVAAWEQTDAVQARARTLLAGFDRWLEEKNVSSARFPGVAYYMLHSFSHLLMTAISLECGYPASSLRERIYCLDNGRKGILIYTGASDAEGTLGGLAAAGRAIRHHVRAALESGTLCSSDPVCAYHVPSEYDHQPLHGSACHGCLLVAETSCEQHNDYLDRALVVPTVEGLGTEFFAGVV